MGSDESLRALPVDGEPLGNVRLLSVFSSGIHSVRLRTGFAATSSRDVSIPLSFIRTTLEERYGEEICQFDSNRVTALAFLGVSIKRVRRALLQGYMYEGLAAIPPQFGRTSDFIAHIPTRALPALNSDERSSTSVDIDWKAVGNVLRSERDSLRKSDCHSLLSGPLTPTDLENFSMKDIMECQAENSPHLDFILKQILHVKEEEIAEPSNYLKASIA